MLNIFLGSIISPWHKPWVMINSARTSKEIDKKFLILRQRWWFFRTSFQSNAFKKVVI